jgi:hypothetical protein
MIIPMNDNADFDINLALGKIQVDDTGLFSKAEQPSVNLLNQILDGKIEMKSHMQSLKTGNLFIEFEIDTKGNGIKVPSGLALTKADFYFLNIGDMALFLTVHFLKYLLKHKDVLELEVKDNGKTADDHIGYGLLIPMYRLMEVYMVYNQHLITQRVKQIQGL